MPHHEMEPPEALRNLVHCFWYHCLDFGEQPVVFEVPPDGYAEIIFYFGSACHLATPSGWQLLPSPFLMPLLQQPARLTTINRLEIIGIRCFPWTVFELLGLSPGDAPLNLAAHALAQLHGPLSQYLQAGQLTEALAQVAQYGVQAQAQMPKPGWLVQAGRAMRAATGTLPVRQVAAAAHVTVRTLERHFKHAAGYTVKDVSSLMRFEQVRNCLLLQPTTNIAALAYTLGYTDQSHLSREFKRYSGVTPAVFARKSLAKGPTIGPEVSAFPEP